MSQPLEICIDCTDHAAGIQNAVEATRGGADRLECCAHMDTGGLTPSPQLIDAIRKDVPEPVEVLSMIRPRAGAFLYDDSEVQTMLQSIHDAAVAGADGVVVGMTRAGRVDRPALEACLAMADRHGLKVTFHRAFDAVSDRLHALDMLLELSVDRVLTAGTPWDGGGSAEDGLPVLRDLADRMNGRMELVIGGGIGPARLERLKGHFNAFGPISWHAYSSVLENGTTDHRLVEQLKQAV